MYEVPLPKIKIEKETHYNYEGEYIKEKLFCINCNSELTKIFDYNNGEFEMNFCPHCGIDLKK